jgi:tRNA1Val (adenine37-N6)-methyltransferase
MGRVFRFKGFEVDQTGCAMKINTDGVLLGAVALHQQPENILDIGTGTGVIALMMAQRFPAAMVDAVEIDEDAAARAQSNCLISPFSERTKVFYGAFEAFESSRKYDMIVSNPPYFVNDLKNTDKRKELARHADEDFFSLLVRKVSGMLSPKGALWLILPVKQAEGVVRQSVLHQLFPSKIIKVYSDSTKEPFRHIICLDFSGDKTADEQVFIYESEGVYTSQYKELLKDFFLAF